MNDIHPDEDGRSVVAIRLLCLGPKADTSLLIDLGQRNLEDPLVLCCACRWLSFLEVNKVGGLASDWLIDNEL